MVDIQLLDFVWPVGVVGWGVVWDARAGRQGGREEEGAVMTVISVIIGQVFHAVPSEIANGIPLDDVAAVLAFTYFGIKILSEALFDNGDGGKSAMDEEFEEAEETVEGSDTINKASAG